MDSPSETPTDTPLKKKRGRKPKVKPEDDSNSQPSTSTTAPKKRGRRRKYEIENFEKLLGRNDENTFDHQISYDDNLSSQTTTDDDIEEDSSLQKNSISFGNLSITVSKKQESNKDEFRRNLLNNVRKHLNKTNSNDVQAGSSSSINIKNKINIDEDEYSDDENKQIIKEDLVNQEEFEKILFNRERYVSKHHENKMTNSSIDRIRVITTLKSFKKEEPWPEKTDVCCWHCCHQFDSPPCFIPKIWDERRNRINFFGVFCSWSCAKTYNSQMADQKRSERMALLNVVIRKINGKYTKISPAPPRQTLKMFGGYLTIDEFRKKHLYCKYIFNDLGMENFTYPEFYEASNVKKIPQEQQKKQKFRLQRPRAN